MTQIEDHSGQLTSIVAVWILRLPRTIATRVASTSVQAVLVATLGDRP